MIGYHFVNGTLRDGTQVPENGITLVYDGNINMCEKGYHFSRTPFEALQYAPGATLCLVECGGELIYADDKGVCSKRTVLKRFDATYLLREFARKCALDVIHLWDAPGVVRAYLTSGDESIRVAARYAAGAAWCAAWYAEAAATAAGAAGAARDAAGDAAWCAARDAAGAARDAAAEAWYAARDAQQARFNAMVAEKFRGIK